MEGFHFGNEVSLRVTVDDDDDDDATGRSHQVMKVKARVT